MKSELAKARDKWLASKGYVVQTAGQYFRSHLECAFIAGWDACVKEIKKRGK